MCLKEKAAAETQTTGAPEAAGGGMGGLGDMFGPQGMQKLMSNPRTASYFNDPQFKNMFDMCKTNP